MYFFRAIFIASFWNLLSNVYLLDSSQQFQFDKSEIIGSIRLRQSSVRSAKFTWTEEVYESKEGRARVELLKAKLKVTPSQSPEESTYLQKQSFSFEGDKTNHVSVDRMFGESGQFMNVPSRSTFDSSIRMMLDGPNDQTKYPYGRIYKEGELNQDLSLLSLEPILQAYFLFNDRMRLISETRCNIKGEETIEDTETGEERRCVVLADKHESGVLTRIFWLDPNRQFVVVKYALTTGDRRIQRQTDFQYSQDPRFGWIPKGWTIKKYTTNGMLISSVVSTVQNYELNTQFAREEFSIEFPVGTYVNNMRDGRDFIVLAGGRKREIMPAEMGATYERLLTSKQGEAAVRTHSNRGWWIAGNAIVIMICILFFLLRKFYRRSVKREAV